MVAFKRWSWRVVSMVCCALVGPVLVPAVARAATSTHQWAVVSKKGVLVASNGATSATRMSKGRYLVQFNTPMNKCAFEATADNPVFKGFPIPTEVTVGQLEGKPKAVFVQTFQQVKGKLLDLPFDLTTYCGTNSTDAVVADTGTLARGSHAVSASHPAPAQYDVIFDHDVHNCVFTATIGSPIAGEVLIPGEITVAGLPGNNNGVIVRTITRQGVDTDAPFHLAVDCGAATLGGVINLDGSVARATHIVSSGHFAAMQPGEYKVIFDRDITTCSHTATVGRPDATALASDPVTISTAPLHGNVNALFVLVQRFDGNPLDESFHLVVTC